MTADHKILSEESESRNTHRYAVAVQGLATQWLQSYPCKTKTFQETQKSLVRSGQRLVRGFHGMLLLSATHSRFPVSLARYFPWICIKRGRNVERRHFGRRH